MPDGALAEVDLDEAHSDPAVELTEQRQAQQTPSAQCFGGHVAGAVCEEMPLQNSASRQSKARGRPPKSERVRLKNFVASTVMSAREGDHDKALHSLVGKNKYLDAIVRARQAGDNEDRDGCGCHARAGGSCSDRGGVDELAEFATRLLRVGGEPALVLGEWSVTSF